MSQSLLILLLLLVGAVFPAPLKVLYVLAPVKLAQDPANPTKIVSVITANSPFMVLKFDKPILAEISKNPAFKPLEAAEESSIVKLELAGELKQNTVVNVTDKKTGDTVMMMVHPEDGKA